MVGLQVGHGASALSRVKPGAVRGLPALYRRKTRRNLTFPTEVGEKSMFLTVELQDPHVEVKLLIKSCSVHGISQAVFSFQLWCFSQILVADTSRLKGASRIPFSSSPNGRVLSVTCGEYSTVALMSSGEMYSWGHLV